MNYSIKKGKILSNNGVPYLPRWFCDDLVSFEVDKYGISKVEYFNQTTKGSEKVFIDDMWGGMRFYIEENGYHSAQRLSKCVIMPYGFKSEWYYKDSLFKLEQRVVNNTIYIVLVPVKLKNKSLKFDVEFYDSWRFTPLKYGNFPYVNKDVDRVWSEFEYRNNTITVEYTEDGEKSTHIKIISNDEFTYNTRTVGFKKNLLITNELEQGKEIIFAIAFDNSEKNVAVRATESIENYKELFEKQNERYEKVIEKSPVLESPYESLNNFFALAPLYHESCKIPSLPGGVHAKTEHYWIWGWDGMSSSFAYAYWNDVDFMSNVLKLYMDTADKDNGIGHWFFRDMSHIQTSMPPAQGFYISLLYQYYMNGGDITPYYDFAKKIFRLIASTEAKGTGLFEGYSLFPDFRDAIDENGNDLSTFNNSSMYCAIRAMQRLAKEMNDSETQIKAEQLANRMKNNFDKILFNDDVGYFVASADSKTLEQREVYTAMSIKWDNKFCYELVEDKCDRMIDFFENNFTCNAGLLPVSVFGKGYDLDANQMHCYWPSNGEIYSRLINFTNRKDLIEQFIGWISCWTDILMCPEGIDCYDNINEPKPDGWNAVNGTWQAYSIRAWYEAIVHSVVGVDFAENGMNIYPYDGEEMTLKNLHFAGKTFDVYMKGSGCRIENVILNGKSIGGVKEIAMSNFDVHNIVEVIRTNKDW